MVSAPITRTRQINNAAAVKQRRSLVLLFSVGTSIWLVNVFVQYASVPPFHHFGPATSSKETFPIPASTSIRNTIKLQNDASKVIKGVTSDENSRTSATFNDIELSYHEGMPKSHFYCVGPTNWKHYDQTNEDAADAWMFRSCRFHNLCFDTNQNEYVLFMPPDWNPTSVEDTTALAIGGINPRWDLRQGEEFGSRKVKWFPKVVKYASGSGSEYSFSGFYQLPPNHILVPFHSFAGHNVGHLIWDDFYPIFSLLRNFGLLPLPGDQQQDQSTNAKLDASTKQGPGTTLVPIRQVLLHKMYAACDIRANKRKQCLTNFDKFLPLLGVNPRHFSTSKTYRFNVSGTGISKAEGTAAERQTSHLVCASTAVSGLGMLTDHGFQDHGWSGTFNSIPHNLGRSHNFFDFSSFLIQNLLRKQQTARELPPVPPIRVTWSLLSSRDKERRLDFAVQLDYLKQVLPPQIFQLQPYKLWEIESLEEQIILAQNSHIFVTACGGGAMTATFLPPGATLILFYDPHGAFNFTTLENLPNKPARLDWDLLNNLGHLRVHWLPITTMDSESDLNLLHQLILHETQIIMMEQKD
ncbi:hypothetical protein ACA910_003230 [Epithemia clementina (nom. ined.)]